MRNRNATTAAVRRALKPLLAVSLCLVAAYAFSAFTYGFGRWQAGPSEAPVRAAALAALLRDVRDGRHEEVVNVLEAMLDAEILADQALRPDLNGALGWWLPTASTPKNQAVRAKLKQAVVDYRDDYPREPADAIERAAAQHLSSWQSGRRIVPSREVVHRGDAGSPEAEGDTKSEPAPIDK